MNALSLKVLTVAAVLGISPLALSAQIQADTSGAQVDAASKMLPDQSVAQIDPVVRAGTAHLNIDDATRAQYRYHNGSWWFLTKQGQWLVEHNGTWKPFDPMNFNNSEPSMSYSNSDYNGTQYIGAGSHAHGHHDFSGIHYGHWGTGFSRGHN
ncbi:hypothetical protein [Gimesia algae]|uniref:Uncharacterized protein n=1 Tax=Gimesia algae TaxID=2527971 RepID=A0A517VL42_9PLAN|nr:hypothetical protein [Gimesia algae]QDT93726.1 hypothetical protein Pan161_54090 [Gimesia algae]